MASKTTTDPIEILLEMGVDLDNLSSEEDYLSALMEAAATIEFQTKGSGDERSAALRKEIIEVRKKRKEADPRFKAKRTKISADSFKKGTAIGGSKGGALVVRPSSSLVPSSVKPEEDEEGAEVKEKEQKESVVKILSDISKTVNSILKTLKGKSKLDKQLARQNRLKAERDKRALAEKNLEKRFTRLKNFAQKMLKPVMGPFDAVMNFIKNVVLGKIVLGIINWLADPKNQQKVQSFIRFLKDWWPALITAVLLFATPLGGIISGIVSSLVGATGLLLKVLPKLLAFLKSPLVVGLGLFAATGAGIYATGKMLGKDKVVENETKRADTSREALEEAESTKDLSAGDREAMVQGTRLKDAGGGGSLNNMPDQFNDPLGLRNDPIGMGGMGRFNQGGQVPGSGNSDTVPAMLTPGEFVIKKEAVQKYGVNTLTSMNSMTKSLPSYEGGGPTFAEKPGDVRKMNPPVPGMGGGGGGLNALTNQAKVRSIPAILRDVFTIFRKKEIDPQTILGEVNESSGKNLAGATADRQLVKVQPGEYILPVDTVTALGGPAALDKIVAQTDSNSTPAKLGMRSQRMIPDAPMMSGPVINVVPMEAPSGSKEAIDPSGSILPNFSAGTGSALKARSLGVVR